MKKNILFICLLLVFGTNAQVKIGDNHTTVNANSILELESTDKGLLLPRLALTSTTSASPMSLHVLGMVIYNTATAGSGTTAVTPGIYYNTGISWEKMVVLSTVIPAGIVEAFAGTTTPTGYLYCNGQAVSRTTYANLFAVIGTTYGAGDGSTTFNLPDYRGYFLRGQNDASGNDPDAASRTNSGNGTTGDNIGTKQSGQVESHNHIDGATTDVDYGFSYGGTSAAPNTSWRYGISPATGSVNPYTSTTGGNETRPKNINVRYYIKY